MLEFSSDMMQSGLLCLCALVPSDKQCMQAAKLNILFTQQHVSLTASRLAKHTEVSEPLETPQVSAYCSPARSGLLFESHSGRS